MIDAAIIAAIEQGACRRMAHASLAWSDEDIEELTAFNEAYGNESGAEAARALADPETLCVITGQQPGALTGPIYTLYKALGTILLAEELRRRLGRRVVAAFWVASDDHDFNEIASVTWPDKDDMPQQTTLEAGVETGAVSAHSIPLADAGEALFDAIGETTHPGDLRDQTLERLIEAAEASSDFEDFFCRSLLLLLGTDSGLILVSPRLSCVRRTQATTLAREFAEPGRSTRLLLEAAKAYEALGEKAPIHRKPGDVNCFLYEDDARAHLTFAEGRFVSLKPAGPTGPVGPVGLVGHAAPQFIAEYTPAQMRELLETASERFSPNVATRPIVQDARFPTIAYVAGPGEQAYLGQIESLYEFFSVCAPAIARRPGATLLEPRIARALDNLGVTAEEFLRLGAQNALSRRARSAGSGIIACIEETAKEVDAMIAALAEAISAPDPATQPSPTRLTGPVGPGGPVGPVGPVSPAGPAGPAHQAVFKGVEKLRESTRANFDRLQQRAIDAKAREDSVTTDRCRRIEQSLRPLGQPQERVFTPFFPFYAHYGETFVPFLRERFAANFAADQIIDLSPLADQSASQ